MCNLYSLTKGQQAIRELARAISDRSGNLPLLPGIYPDYRAPSYQDTLRSLMTADSFFRGFPFVPTASCSLGL